LKKKFIVAKSNFRVRLFKKVTI